MSTPSAGARPLRVALVAGEPSGDLLAALLLRGLRARWPEVQAFGIGGPRMQAEGFDPWWSYEKLAVRGYVEVLRHYREIVGIRNQLRERLLADPPDVFIGVDAPDFNLDLEATLRAAGVKTVHFVCPSIWAWRMKRVEKLRLACDHVLCIFPFEPELLARHGVPASYVGHPLAAVMPTQPDRAGARAGLGLPNDAPVVALLPGSRNSEIEQMAGLFIAAARLLRAQRPDIRFVLPSVPHQLARIRAAVAGAGGVEGLALLEGRSHEALAACDVALVASGTATLETALFKRPMVIAYHTHPINWWIVEHFVHTRWAGLPNILAGEGVVPELLQHAATPEAIAAELGALLDDPTRQAAMRTRFDALHRELRRDTARAATDAIAQILQA